MLFLASNHGGGRGAGAHDLCLCACVRGNHSGGVPFVTPPPYVSSRAAHVPWPDKVEPFEEYTYPKEGLKCEPPNNCEMFIRASYRQSWFGEPCPLISLEDLWSILPVIT